MPIDDLPGILTTTTRDAERKRWLRDYSYFKPDDSTAPGTEPYLQASSAADFVMPLYADLAKLALAMDPNQLTGRQLEIEAEPVIGPKLSAGGASGSVTIAASSSGTEIFRGDEFKINSVRYECAKTANYADRDAVPIVGIDTGPQTNQKANTPGTWSNPRPGCASTASVTPQTDGSGLKGGHDVESDDAYRLRWLKALADPPGGGNDAQVRALAENEEATGIAIEKAFTYPAVYGPGTSSIALVTPPQTAGGSRIPSLTNLAFVMAYVIGSLPPDCYFGAATVASNVAVTYRVTWMRSAPGWIDLAPWPWYPAAPSTAIVDQAIVIAASPAPTATTFRVSSRNASYTNLTAPAAGKRIAIYDAAHATFVRKTIASITGTGPWDIVCDTSNQASDVTYVPIAGQRVSPWSDSLQNNVDPAKPSAANLVSSVLAHFARLGPGEQYSTFMDQGWRRRRQPVATATQYPNVLTDADLTKAAYVAGIVEDVSPVEPTLPYSTPTGSPGTYVYLLQLNDLAVLPAR